MHHYIFSKTFIISVLFLQLILPAVSQEKIGISNSNYSSINNIHLNPSSSVDSRTFVQLNIIGAHLYEMNNTAYLPNFSVWSVKGKEPAINTSSQKKFLYLKSDVSVPGFVVSNRKIGFGIFARARAEIDLKRIPYELAEIISKQQIDTLQPTHEINIKNAKIGAMAWTEYGVNFGGMISRRNGVMMTLGGNLKYLTGIGLAYYNLKELNTIIDKNHMQATIENSRVRYSMPKWNSGKGVGTDIGFTYKKMLSSIDNYFSNSKLSNCTYIDYRYKIGVSILDAGFIRYNTGTYKGDISGTIESSDYKNTNVDSLIRAEFSVSQQTNKPLYASTPTGISVQTDWNLGYYMKSNAFKHMYLNATIVQSVLTKKVTGVQRSNTLSLTPRYERKNIEVALPVKLYNYQKLQLGLAFRFRTFVLGVDNVMPLIKKSDTYSVGVYTNLGISLFKNPACWKKKKRFPKLKKMLSYFPTIFHVNRKGKDNHKLDSKGQGDGKKVDDCPDLESPKKKEK